MLCILGFSWAILRCCPRDHTIKVFLGLQVSADSRCHGIAITAAASRIRLRAQRLELHLHLLYMRALCTWARPTGDRSWGCQAGGGLTQEEEEV